MTEDAKLGVLAPIRRVPAAEAVLRALRKAIRDGTFPVGSKLPSEAKLAAEFGVSRPVVREALLGCATLGLTVTRTGSGTRVVSQTEDEGLKLGRYSARELSEARPHIEMPAVALAAAHRSDGDVATLRQLIDDMEAITRGELDGGIIRWVELDARFHTTIARLSGNGIFERMVGEIREAMVRQSGFLTLVAARAEESDVEHRRILEAIAAGAPGEASAAMSHHLRAVDAAVDRIDRL